jgi:hypothetical protein
MKKELLLVMIVVLALPSAFCASSLLRLERSETPGGPWQELPANTLPVTADGAFHDTYESATGYYHMRIDPAHEWGFPLNIPYEDVPLTAAEIAKNLLTTSRDLEGWEDARVGPIAFPIYTLGVDGPAYIEFALLSPQPEPPDMPFGDSTQKAQPTSGGEAPLVIGDCGLESRGHILVSLTEDDFPVVSFATDGLTRTECLRRKCGTSAVRIVMYLGSALAAEDQNGNLLAWLGGPPIRFSSDVLQYANEQYEQYVNPQGSQQADPPPVQFGPYASYEEFKKDYPESKMYQEIRNRRREAAKPDWDAELGRLPEEMVVPLGGEITVLENKKVSSITFENPDLVGYKLLSQGVQMQGLNPGVTLMHVVFADHTEADYVLAVTEKTLSAEEPTGLRWTSWQYWYVPYTEFQRCYTQEEGASCWSGCGTTAWAMLYGYWDMCDCLAASFGVPDLIPGDLIAGCPTPNTNTAAVQDCIWYISPRVGTYCVGDQGATNPWDMDGGTEWADFRGGVIDYYDRHTIPGFEWTWTGPRDLAIDEIKNHNRPSMVGFGFHYGLAYGYRYRELRGTLTGWVFARKRELKVNMGWGCSKQWRDAGILWYAARAILMWP